MIRPRTPIIACLLVASGIGLFAGCGYKSDGLYRGDVKSIAVPIFESRLFRREIEDRLTEALIKRIELDTPWKVVDKRRADTILTGELLEVRQASAAPDFETGLPRIKVLNLLIRFEWKDLRTGKILVKRRTWVQTGEYFPPVNETEYLGTNEVIDRMAESIVEELQNDW